jgi:hypothetical protein
MRFSSRAFPLVMAGLVPAIHVFTSLRRQDVDARHKTGHDGVEINPAHLPGIA